VRTARIVFSYNYFYERFHDHVCLPFLERWESLQLYIGEHFILAMCYTDIFVCKEFREKYPNFLILLYLSEAISDSLHAGGGGAAVTQRHIELSE
jgi:hypothetical protein